ncbi:MAG TPA: hypothetical protein VGK73_15620 [Polyangiaceae bacterium]
MKRLAGLSLSVLATLLLTWGCGVDPVDTRDRGDDDDDGPRGGTAGAGTAGSSTAGANASGSSNVGGSASGSTSVGGASGSTNVGGASGSFNVGGASGSVSVGGASGSVGVGGASGSVSVGGSAGTDPAGGSSGTGTAGTGGTGNTTYPPGYWTSQMWHGCAWTGVGTEGASTISPMDFVAKPPADAYCVSGSVGAEPEYKSVALLGFNTGEDPPPDCAYEPVDVNGAGPPGVSPQATGIAVNFVKRGTNTAFTWRVQLQGPNGHKEGTVGENDRWCATITEVQGKVFVPYTSFTPKCWEMDTAMRGTPYAGQPISAVVFLVPGAPTATPFDFCVNGFTYGDSAEDAPDGPEMVGNQTGTVGGSGSDDLDFDRAKIVVGGENYIIQNNNWGNPGGSDCILNYVNNSFTVGTCNGSGSDAPASFPSIYQGNNGNTGNGVYSTKTTDSMPIQVSNIASAVSSFRYSGPAGQSNACYDIWFANSPPTAEYQDGINGFVMIWLRDPPGKQPIGTNQGSVTIAGQSWNKWVGPRGAGPAGQNNSPVVSFVNPAEGDDSRAQSFVEKNILEFIQAASGNGISSSMYLTDVFAGFEIWSGGGGQKVDEFKLVVTPK